MLQGFFGPIKGEAEQYYFIVCVPFRCSPDALVRADDLLRRDVEALKNPARDDMRKALDASRCIHFMSMSVISDPDPGERHFLVMEVAADGKRATVIDTLVNHAGCFLRDIFAKVCPVSSNEDLKACFRAHHVRAVPWLFKPFWMANGLRFHGTPDLSVRRILADQRIAERACATIASEFSASTPTTARAVWQKVRGEVLEATPEELSSAKEATSSASKGGLFAWTLFLTGMVAWMPWLSLLALWLATYLVVGLWPIADTTEFWTRNADFLWGVPAMLHPVVDFFFNGFLTLIIIVAVTVAALAAYTGGALTVLRWHERHDWPKDRAPDPAAIHKMMLRESQSYQPDGPQILQNHMTAVSIVKPGLFFRKFVALKFGLHFVAITAKSGVFKKGFLSSIGTIHFAQWVRIKGTRKLLFLSNYDGGWESYLEDFITKAHKGLNAIWSNTVGYPKTNWLLLDGGADGDRFKRWVRSQMIPTSFWYTAYPTLSADHIRRNQKIRQGLSKEAITQSEAAEWLSLFGSAPPAVDALETHEMQSLLLSGLRRHEDATCFLIRFESDVAARTWLRDVQPHIAFGRIDDATARFVAFTKSGLKMLGLDGTGFPPAFALGMADPSRRNVLGDVNESSPCKWKWGGSDTSVDAALLVYAKASKQQAPIEAETGKERERFKGHKIKYCEVTLQRLPEKGKPIEEPFGFVDGLSQPQIKGLARPSSDKNSIHLLEAGEFILGYEDTRKCFPPTLEVKASLDRNYRLPDLPEDLCRVSGREVDDWPAWRDFGRNGSFLVIRQLEQKVDKFERFLEDAAATQKERNWIAAKMVGRWQNGAPLVRFPDGPPKKYDLKTADNEFLFGKEDAQALACPFGAHIRRANPRDHDDPGRVAISNRHRILRRGRAYVAAPNDRTKDKGEGLLFMCFNADIERQFEFLQHAWIGRSAFAGLKNETDPLTSTVTPPGKGVFTIPTLHGPKTITGLSSFVTVLGGGYFFMPSRRALRFLTDLGNVDVVAQSARNSAMQRDEGDVVEAQTIAVQP